MHGHCRIPMLGCLRCRQQQPAQSLPCVLCLRMFAGPPVHAVLRAPLMWCSPVQRVVFFGLFDGCQKPSCKGAGGRLCKQPPGVRLSFSADAFTMRQFPEKVKRVILKARSASKLLRRHYMKQWTAEHVRMAGAVVDARDTLRSCVLPALHRLRDESAGNPRAVELIENAMRRTGGVADRLRMSLKRG